MEAILQQIYEWVDVAIEGEEGRGKIQSGIVNIIPMQLFLSHGCHIL
jgi:hypothetical protein